MQKQVKQRLFYIGLFTIVCLISLWILHSARTMYFNEGRGVIASYLSHAVLTEFNAQGQIKTRITADRVTHFDENNQTTFQNPAILIYSEDRSAPWKIQADAGESDKSGDTLRLFGHVVAQQLSNDKHPETTIKTTTLTLYPKKSFITSTATATIIRPDTTIQG